MSFSLFYLIFSLSTLPGYESMARSRARYFRGAWRCAFSDFA